MLSNLLYYFSFALRPPLGLCPHSPLGDFCPPYLLTLPPTHFHTPSAAYDTYSQ